MKKERSLEDFRLPRWQQLPPIPLYLEQGLALLEEWLGPYLGNEEGKVLTKTMINNYVKLHFIEAPLRRKYDRLTVASLFVIAVLKPVYTIEEIGYLIRLALGHSDTEVAYDGFCDYVEAAVSHAFHRTTMEKESNPDDPRQLLWNACNAFACQLYVRRIYLEDAMAAAGSGMTGADQTENGQKDGVQNG